MLIDKFPFQNSLSLLLKHTKCTLNLRSLGFPSADPSREENSDQGIQGKFATWSFAFFFKATTEYLCIFFNFHFPFVHLIGAFYQFYWQERRFAEFASILPR